jgi:outer membrane lipoprotein
MFSNLAKCFVFLLFAACLSGCAASISSQVRQEVVKDLTFALVAEDPAAYAGSTVLWGGKIMETVPLEEGSDLLVLQTPLDFMERPKDLRHSQGRFIARSPLFLDPEIFGRSKEITLAGEIIGEETRMLGKRHYAYPVVAVRELHLWREREIYPHTYYFRHYGPGPGWRLGWGWYSHGPY